VRSTYERSLELRAVEADRCPLPTVHWGETKTWYGVPGEDAEKFEEALRREAPDLFEQDPALLFQVRSPRFDSLVRAKRADFALSYGLQLVTLMNPGRLRKAGVRVYALDQRANEIVITFPKAFHAGFNHGVRRGDFSLACHPTDASPSARSSTIMRPSTSPRASGCLTTSPASASVRFVRPSSSLRPRSWTESL
jgi:hypothetical protein